MINVGGALLSLGLKALLDRLRRSAPSPCLSAHVVEGSSNRRLTPDRADGVHHRAADYGHSANPRSNAASIRQSHYAYAYNHGNRQNVTSWWVGTKCADVLNGQLHRRESSLRHRDVEKAHALYKLWGLDARIDAVAAHSGGNFSYDFRCSSHNCWPMAACSSRTGRRSPGRRAHRPSLRTSVGEAERRYAPRREQKTGPQHRRLYVPSIEEATHPRCDCEGYPGSAGQITSSASAGSVNGKVGPSWRFSG